MKLTSCLLMILSIFLHTGSCSAQAVDVIRKGDSEKDVRAMLSRHFAIESRIAYKKDGRIANPEVSVELSQENCLLMLFLDTKTRRVRQIQYGVPRRSIEGQKDEVDIRTIPQFVFMHRPAQTKIKVGDTLESARAAIDQDFRNRSFDRTTFMICGKTARERVEMSLDGAGRISGMKKDGVAIKEFHVNTLRHVFADRLPSMKRKGSQSITPKPNRAAK